MALRAAVASKALARPQRVLAPLRSAPRPLIKHASPVVVRAAEPVSEGTSDFDALLVELANKFEKVENKPVVIGYLSAAVVSVFFAEWLIHLPLLDVLLGFPIQLIGIFALPVLVQRYYMEKKDYAAEATDIVNSISKQLPGLEK